jgi:ABC-type glycerol-3-phosphate transport system permease component
MTARRLRTLVLIGLAALLLAVWAFPVLWALLTSFKTERDVLAYPPTVIFEPTLRNYRDVLFGSASILPNLVSSTIVAGASTLLTLVFAIPAAYALARLDLPAKRASGFYVLATQMLPPVGLIIPSYLVLQKIGGLESYGIAVTARAPLEVEPHAGNIAYLRTKQAKLGHLLSGLQRTS